MQTITQIQGLAVPLEMDDVDTDLIIPAQYLTSVSKSGYGQHLFKRLREADTDFVFNQPKYQQANILITRNNFGCGSSREHAVWALQQAGIEAVIAISFADIFADNCTNNGVILIELAEEVIQNMLLVAREQSYEITIDIQQQQLSTNKGETFQFPIDAFYKHRLLNGLDKLSYLLSHEEAIHRYRAAQADKYFVRM